MAQHWSALPRLLGRRSLPFEVVKLQQRPSIVFFRDPEEHPMRGSFGVCSMLLLLTTFLAWPAAGREKKDKPPHLKERASFTGHTSEIWGLAFSRDGKTL